ncbi:uncharacterized protein MONOS_12364 [Monocercomonoides exilis]|uniref:uncharacterized protein n=1 Tax=Monocercomonoides exilis TaxID=2049356 RepID=UPI00355AAE10|nr:hypothetical protein MONOS_12364 [Monocercomonoides exilis]|eukprot:MONOS_12364.1-p1 / transcript=MONOS_12364.1 / gene=MONOS_12364 / organism=Monocercomonoides_exilis_PA203 / gene_product=unspecified product / transcript_product=unspecified product / location=Mono_scaffold00680:13058-15139(-) / protein_length=556 / sequence_SO=supercontig / SO=protein_coding / is_pseudo=false
MWEMDEVGEAQQDCEGAGFSILHRATQRYALRVERRKLVHEPMVCGSQQRRERIGLEWGGAPQRQSEEAIGAIVAEAEYAVQQEACGLCQPGSCSYNGRISVCSGSNLEYCGECATFPQSSQPNMQGTDFELQRAFGCSPCAQQLFFQPGAQQNPQPAPPFGQYLSSFQYQQVGSRTELDLSAEKDSICMSSDGGDIEVHSHSGRKESDSRLAVKTCNRRRLRDSDSKSSRSRSSSGSRPRCGRIRKHMKHEKTDMVWARKPLVHGRLGRRLERRSHLDTSPCAPHNALSEKNPDGKSESGSSSTSLEKSSVESIVRRDGDSSSCMEGRKGGPDARRRSKKDGSISTTGRIHGSAANLVADEGEIWLKQSMRQCGVTVRIQGASRNTCRFRKLAQLSMMASIVDSSAVHLQTKLKTTNSPSFITVPFLDESNAKICPARTFLYLWEFIKQRHPECDTFLLNTMKFTPLTVEGIRKLARIGMTWIGVPKHYRPYTIKHAAISTLMLNKVPEALVAKYARLSPTAHTPSRFYLSADLSHQMADKLISASSTQSPILQ